MVSPVSPATREKLHRTQDDAGLLVLLQIEHPAIAAIYLVNDTRDWLLWAHTWVGLPFRFKLPSSTQGEAPRARLEVDNVGSELTAELEALPPGAALQARIVVVSRATPTVIDFEFTAPLSGVTATMGVVQATMGFDDALRGPAVAMRFDLSTAPALFEG